MKFILLLATILMVGIGLCQGSVYTEKNFHDEKHSGKCVFGGKVLTPGQSIKHPIMDCAEIICDNSVGMATIETCDPISALPSPLQNLKNYDHLNPPKCTWGDFKNIKAQFPKCCERHFTCTF